MGYYGGDGARRVATVEPSASLPQEQPPCEVREATGLVDCGTWEESASWPVPADAVSGIYFAKLVREDQPSEGSHVLFVVRDDASHSDLLFQTSDTTWQAYNRYGGNSLYTGGPGTDPGRAYKVSYNRPLTTRGPTPEDDPFSAEYPMVRWLERNGYDVSYFTGVDADRRGAEIQSHGTYLSVGHDEYWSRGQRENVEAAREAGVNLAFFSGDEIFWKTRWEDSVDGSGTDHRTLVCYKETHANSKIDPEADAWTGTWRDPRFSPPADGGKPENSLSGTSFTVDEGTSAIKVPAADGKLRLWRETDIASLAPGQTATLAEGTLGYEWDEDLDNGFRPPGLMDLSSTTVEVPEKLLDYGSSFAPGTATHHLTLYRASSGALVFGAGTVQWSWGLDGVHDRGGSTPDPRMQQATVNLLADMGAQPGSLQGDLVATSRSTDSTPPTTTIGSPSGGAHLQSGTPTTISGTATDAAGGSGGGQVAGVEVSTDDGGTWHPAQGRDQWTYSWTPGTAGGQTIEARAVDDSGNLEQPGAAATVLVDQPHCPCSVWDESLSAPEDSDPKAIELGLRFRSDVSGFVTGVSFYKRGGNTGVHVGRLWTAGGTQLAQATFTGETASGWQHVSFDSPVPIAANTTYVASYYAPNGHYSSLDHYFSAGGAGNPPLHALADGADGGNGVFMYGPSGGLFSEGGPETFEGTNYLVDPIFDEQAVPDTTPPTVNGRAPAAGATEISTNVSVGATFDEAIDPATVTAATLRLRDPSGTVVPATVSYDAASRRATLDPSGPLQHSNLYTVTAKGGPGGIEDSSGNPLAADTSWSFTTGEPPPPPPDSGPGGPILVISNGANPFSGYYAEILRAEGLNEFAVRDIGSVTPSTLDSYDVAILGEGTLSDSQAQMLESWVDGGGNLIAMRPEQRLAGLLGLGGSAGTLSNAYLKVDTGTGPGAGIVGQTIQFHGGASRYAPTDAETIATLYSDASTATPNPAVTLREVGPNGGHAAAFSYDLAKSVVYTRQGNPEWAGEDRDGEGPIRSDDLFFGAKPGDAQPDWVNLNKVAIPQADEQQRLLTNLIERINEDRKPLPRFWFLPRDKKAAVVMTGDDHGNDGTAGRFEKYEEDSPPGCVVAEWQCVRSTSYIYPSTPLSDSQASAFTAAGFELGLHVLTNCENWTSRANLESFYSGQLEALANSFPNLPAPATNRTHCVVWSDWASQPKVELENGIRLDTDYYYWPGSWVKNRPGMFTGSGMPMRFAEPDGSMIDVYQAPTQMTDESEQTYPFTVDTLLDKALGPNGYYGVFTANMHTDGAESAESDAIVASAQARGVPIVSAKQMLTWLDGRNQSSFGSIGWSGNRLSFTIDRGKGANGLRAMLPLSAGDADLLAVEREGQPVPTSVETIKGIQYAFFDAAPGSYEAAYEDAVPPAISSVAASGHEDGTATISWKTSERSDSRVDYGTSPDALSSSVATPAAVKSHSIELPGLTPDATYYYRVSSADSSANSATDPAPPSAPRSFLEPLDVTPPQTSLGSHPPALTSATAAEFAFSGSDAGSGLKGFECRLDGGAWSGCVSPQTYASLADGSHSFEVRAIDNAGNADGSPASFDWTVDATAPSTQIDSGPPALTNSAAAEFAFSGGDGAGSGVASFECRLDGGAWSGCTSPRAYASLADGGHGFEVRAIDSAGNVDATPATFAWTVDTTAPETQIDSKPPVLTNSATAQFAFAGGDGSGSGVASFECRLDGGAWNVCTSPQSYASLGDGGHGFEVRAVDSAGNADQSPATFAWTVDTTPPALTVDSLSKTLVGVGEGTDLHWHASENGNFELRLGGGDCATGTVLASGAYGGAPSQLTTAIDGADLGEGANTLRLCLTDAASNRGSATATVTKDTTAPSTQIDSHPPALTNSPNAEFAFSGADPGGSGIASFECRLDAGTWGGCGSPQSYGSLSDGSHGFEVRAIDAAGNVDATPAASAWSVDTTAPQTQIASSPAVLTNSAAAEFVFSGADGSGSGVASFECRRDGGPWTGCTSPQGYASLSDGSHSFEVRAIDNAGNADGSPASFDWSIDTTPPTTQIDSHPPALTNNATAEFVFSGGDGSGADVASFECRRDGGSWSGCTSPQIYASLADGSHSFEVRAVDNAGNADPSPASFGWTVDTAPPTVTIDSGASGLTNDPTPTFVFHSPEFGTSFECSLDTGVTSFGSCSAQGSHTPDQPLAEGHYSFRVRATDAAGNQSLATQSFTVDTTAPPAPTLSGTNPASPANENSPKVLGSASDGSTVHLYTTADCSGTPLASGSAAGLAAGIEISVPDDSTTVLRADTTSPAGNTSACSAPLTYVEDSTAPNAQIDSGPAALTNSAAAEFIFSGGDGPGSGVASFECRLDGGAWSGCTSPRSYASLADGGHSFEVRAIDNAGNVDATPASFAWTVDTTVPPPPTLEATSPASPANENSPDVLGSAPAGSTVRIYATSDCSGTPLASGSAAQFAIGIAVTVPDDSSTALRATATSAAGNTSPCSAALTYVEDSTAPQTQIDSGPQPLTNSAAATFAFSGADGSGSGVASFECSLDGGPWSGCTSPQIYSSLADGGHTFEARAVDNAGNADVSPASFDWTVDTALPSPPTLSETHPASPANENSPKVVGLAPDGSTVRIYATPDCSGTPLATGSAAALAAGIEVPVPGDASTSLRATATSTAGNTSACSAPLTYVEDSTAPETRIDSHPLALTDSASAQFAFSGADGSGSGVASFECRRDAGAWAPCTSPRAYTSLADGSHSFEARAIDSAGNVDATPAAFAWTVDTSVPPGKAVTPTLDIPGNVVVPAFVRFVGAKYRAGTVLLVLRVSGPGRLSANAPKASAPAGRRKAGARSAAEETVPQRIESGSVRVAEAGQVKLPVKLTPLGKRLLGQKGQLKVAVELSFESLDGTSASRTMTIALKRKPRPARAD